MRILVLGGTGAMGEALVDILEKKGYEIYVTSRKKHQNTERITFFEGDAHDITFLKELLKLELDVVVDFMYYTLEELQERIDVILSATKQYFFLSSSRVYSDSKKPIKESCPRLLDVCTDSEYLMTGEYALAKAREENILNASEYKNWTIIRPYITYSNIRLQLGVLEKEQWLYRALKGRSIVFSEKIVNHITSLTYGYDVSKTIVDLMGNSNALGECVHIVDSENYKWSEILNIYLNVIEEVMGERPKVKYINYEDGILKILGNKYQYFYDRLYDRIFDSEKVEQICGKRVEYTLLKDGLKRCVKEFIQEDKKFRNINWKYEAYVDRVCRERTKLREIDSFKWKLKYLIFRYTPYFKYKGIKFSKVIK